MLLLTHCTGLSQGYTHEDAPDCKRIPFYYTKKERNFYSSHNNANAKKGNCSQASSYDCQAGPKGGQLKLGYQNHRSISLEIADNLHGQHMRYAPRYLL